MLLNIYRVDGTLEPPDNLVGTAHDIRTAISLLRLLRAHNGTACKLLGYFPGVAFETQTQCSINDASLLLLRVLLDDTDGAPALVA